MVTRLPRADGFSQRHNVQPGVTKYLKALDAGYNYWRSPVTLPLIRDDILSFSNDFSGPVPPLLQRAIGYAYRAFRLPKPVQMLHLNDLFTYPLKIWPRSPGIPWRALGYKTKREVADSAACRKSIRWFWHRVKNGERIGAPDSSAFVRSHLAPFGENKVRAVWGYPMTVTMGEAVFSVPLIEAYQSCNSPIAYGYETAIGGMKRLTAEFNSKFYVALDFKSFDKTVPAFLVKAAFDILSSNIDFENYRDYGVADIRKTSRMWEYIVRYFIHTPIRLANGERYRKHSGVASGSYFTQLVDSIVNYIIVVWCCLELEGCVPFDIKVLGDDSIFGTRHALVLSDFADIVSRIGMTINVKKSSSSRRLGDLEFLGYTINDGTPSKPHDRWMSALLYPEFPDRKWDDVASRAYGLYLANFAVDYQFHALCLEICSFRRFAFRPSAGLTRMLDVIGWSEFPGRPPDLWDFFRRLQVL
uniref:RdRp n=1 Tax=Hubei partiti-like virus 41 TaxID=1923049 RepID=A0A1L3KLF2_9VIRU|nr:RdRp [Hubei partiti-like virus 41]